MPSSTRPFSRELKDALDAFVRGEAGPYKALWSRSEDGSIFGAFGGQVRGWEKISQRLDWAAKQYRDGVYEELDVLAEVVGSDLAYLVSRERIKFTAQDGTLITRQRRVTHIYRLEGEAWRIVHQHSDPLVDVQLP